MTVTEKTGYFVGGAWHTGIHPSLIGKRIVRTCPCECPYGMDYSYSVLGKYGPRDPKPFEALYQGNPTIGEGELLKRAWWKFYEINPRQIAASADEVIQSWDCAFKDLKTSDYVVGQVWARKNADMFLIDQVRGLMDFPATLAAIKTMTAKWPMTYRKLIEDKANGTAVIQTLKHKIPGIMPVEPEGGKVARAHAVSGAIEAGDVYLPGSTDIEWVFDFIEECSSFPNGKHDDQVDAMSQALKRWVVIDPDTKIPVDMATFGSLSGGQKDTLYGEDIGSFEDRLL